MIPLGPDVTNIVNIVKDFGYLGILVVILVTGARKVWVFGRELEDVNKLLGDARAERDRFREQLEDMRHQRDEWHFATIQGKALAERAAAVSVQALNAAERAFINGPE